jgi:hypothetical protein
MLPVLERFYAFPSQGEDTHNSTFGGVVLQRIYELAPQRGRELILKEIANPTGRAEFEVLSLLPDKSLPGMDKVFAAALEKRDTVPKQLPLQMKLLSRYGTPAILPRIKSVMQDPEWSSWRDVESPVIAYCLRVDPAFGTVELEKALTRNTKNGGNKSVLKSVSELYFSPELEAAAIRHLDDPDLEIVHLSVEILGKHGSAEAEAPLLKRFQKWHDEWTDRADQLQIHWPSNDSAFDDVRMLESAFRAALTNATSWVADAKTLKLIQSLCLTDSERDQVQILISEAHSIRLSYFQEVAGNKWSLEIARFQTSSLDAAMNKLAQFPKGTVFEWYPFDGGRPDEQQKFVLKQLKGYLTGIGMEIKER